MKLRPSNTMKLSDKTLSVLKNFSSINQSILFKQGNKLRTISVMKNILAEATVSPVDQYSLQNKHLQREE